MTEAYEALQDAWERLKEVIYEAVDELLNKICEIFDFVVAAIQ